MKCAKCGANLAMENAFCPYCGNENRFAKQHRADMDRFTEDYKRTKERVISDTKKFNIRSFRIAMVVVTIATFILLLVFSTRLHEHAWEYSYKKNQKNSPKYEAEVAELVANEDYLGLNELVRKHDISFRYNTDMYQYSHASNVAYDYQSLYQNILYMLQPTESYASNYVTRVVNSYDGLYNDAKEEYGYRNATPEVRTFAEHAYRDAGLLLKTYLGLTDEDLENWPNLSDAKKNLLIEEAYENVQHYN